MIPLRYRQQLPRYWYENDVAEAFFVGAGGEADGQRKKSKDIQNQFLLPLATWGLDLWDWIYFGDRQMGSDDERRENIRRKNLAKSRFTLSTLHAIGSQAGKLDQVSENFLAKEIVFEFASDQPVQLQQLSKDFERIRPVHVVSSKAVVKSRSEALLINCCARSFEVDFPVCGEFYPDGNIEGFISNDTIYVAGAARTFITDYPITNDFFPATE